MSKIKKVESQLNLPQIEEKVSKFWKDNRTFQKSIENRSPDSPSVFVDGPPFVSGSPHYGHLLCSIAKDVIPRYLTMRGKRVRRVFGWDCHGLPIEEKVNKKLGIKSNKQLEEEVGIDNYVKECRNYVKATSNDWKWYVEKVGRWVDMENAYYTMSPEYTESVMWAFKQIWEKGYIYKGKRVSLYSTDTSTPVSNFEVAMDPDNYREVEDLSIFVKFEISDPSKIVLPKNNSELEYVKSKPIYLVAWTTTPWTIPSNMALAVNPDEDYVLVEFEGEYYILAESRVSYTFNTSEKHVGGTPDKLVKIIGECKGKYLEGLRYKPIYDFFVEKTSKADFKVYLYEGVTTEEGTGVLHIAPAFGEEDFNLGKKYGLSDYADIDEAGKITVGDWKGVYLRDASPLIADDLAKKGNLLRSEMFTHRLPFYRGENPLIYMAQDSYFINIQDIKSDMIKNAQGINWVPNHLKEGRWKQTIESSPDWAISRSRYWATIMPIWRSEDGDELVIGSYEELMKYTRQVIKVKADDKIKYYFVKNPSKYINEIEEYFNGNSNVWIHNVDLESSLDFEELSGHRDVMDKIVLSKNGKEYRRIPEVLDCWMDSGCAPFAEYHYPFENKDVFEKSFPADFIIEYIGQVRAWFNVLHRISTIIFNSRAFTNVVCTGVLAGYDGRKMSKSYGNYPDPKEVLSNVGAEAFRLYTMGSPIMVGGDMNWSDELLNEQIKNVLIPFWNIYKYFTIYADVHDFSPKNVNFVSDNVLDKWLESYIKKQVVSYSRALDSYNIPESVKLIQPTIDNISAWWIRRSRDRFVNGDLNALQTLYAALVTIIKAFAPQMPFITEEIYQNIVRSILPEAKESVHLEDFPMFDENDIDETLLLQMDLVKDICNLGLSIRVKNSLKVRQPLKEVLIYVKNMSLLQERNSISQVFLSEDLIGVIKDELNVKELKLVSEEIIGRENYDISENNQIQVALCTEVTSELREEGLYAELKRQIQNLRKISGLQIGEKAFLKLKVDSEELKEFVKKYSEKLKYDTVLVSLDFVVRDLKGFEIKIDNVRLKAEISKA